VCIFIADVRWHLTHEVAAGGYSLFVDSLLLLNY